MEKIEFTEKNNKENPLTEKNNRAEMRVAPK